MQVKLGMSGIDKLRSAESFELQLREKADRLVALLAQGDVSAAMDQINELYAFRHRIFYQEVGALTRTLHDALKSFGADVHDSLRAGEAPQLELNDASQSLDYVVELTEKNAHQTMDRLDKAMGLLDTIEAGTPDAAMQKHLSELRGELTDILVAQGYQDIAGQLIRKVITLLTSAEEHLVQLMNMAANVDRLAGEPAVRKNTAADDAEPKEQTVVAEGPQIKGKDGTSAACEQDEVDELLSSLGF
jgi:chemotaxis protein CheZ